MVTKKIIYKKNKNWISREIDNKIALINIGDNSCIIILENESAKKIFNLINGKKDINQIKRELKNFYIKNNLEKKYIDEDLPCTLKDLEDVKVIIRN